MVLDQDISSAFIATQILLVFVSVFFTLYYGDITDLLNNRENLPKDKYERKDKLNELIPKTYDILNKCRILVIINLIIFLLFLPIFLFVCWDAITYITSIKFTQWSYNFNQTSFFAITIIIFCFLFWSSKFTIKAYKLKNEYQEELDDLTKSLNK